jgi:NAD(P)-dependent dehydrogenase (short-subunit alcohol dehydrogenase family)
LALLGRSAEPGDEAADLADAPDLIAVRKALVERGELTRPAEIEAAALRVLADREIRRTLRELQRSASDVRYLPVDVTDASALRQALTEIRSAWGSIDGIIHAAGVREDKLMRDKAVESFARVYDTKIEPVGSLLAELGEDGFAVFFASVSGAFGNAGQCDYAAANAALDGIAQAVKGDRGPRVLSIDWGPWSGAGMVSPELAREYERRGIGLIDPADGVAALIDELEAGLPDPQVIFTAGAVESYLPVVDPGPPAATTRPPVVGEREPDVGYRAPLTPTAV